MPPMKRKRKRRPLTLPKKKRNVVHTENLIKKLKGNLNKESYNEEDEHCMERNSSAKSPLQLVLQRSLQDNLFKKPGRRNSLPPRVEKKLYKFAQKRELLGMTLVQFLEIVGEVAVSLDMPFPKGVPGKHWYSNMMARHSSKADSEENDEDSDSCDESSYDPVLEKVDEAIEEAIESFHLRERNKEGKKRASYGSYNENDMQKAIDAVNEGEMKIYRAALHFNVPRSTLRDRVSGVHPSGSKAGSKRVLSHDVEKELYVLAKKRRKLGMTTPDFLEIAGDVAVENKMPFSKGRPSVNWMRKMLKRNRSVKGELDSESADSSDENVEVLSVRSSRKRAKTARRRNPAGKKWVSGSKKLSGKTALQKETSYSSPENESDPDSSASNATLDDNSSFENALSSDNESPSDNNSSDDKTSDSDLSDEKRRVEPVESDKQSKQTSCASVTVTGKKTDVVFIEEDEIISKKNSAFNEKRTGQKKIDIVFNEPETFGEKNSTSREKSAGNDTHGQNDSVVISEMPVTFVETVHTDVNTVSSAEMTNLSVSAVESMISAEIVSLPGSGVECVNLTNETCTLLGDMPKMYTEAVQSEEDVQVVYVQDVACEDVATLPAHSAEQVISEISENDMSMIMANLAEPGTSAEIVQSESGEVLQLEIIHLPIASAEERLTSGGVLTTGNSDFTIAGSDLNQHVVVQVVAMELEILETPEQVLMVGNLE